MAEPFGHGEVAEDREAVGLGLLRSRLRGRHEKPWQDQSSSAKTQHRAAAEYMGNSRKGFCYQDLSFKPDVLGRMRRPAQDCFA
jgi:hypothetical protein